MDQYQLSLIQAARANLRDARHMGTFSPERWVGFIYEGAAYRARGYTTSAGVMFDLHGAKDGKISSSALYAGLPVIPQVACVKDEYARSVIRCHSVSREQAWIIEQGVPHQVVIADYEVLPGDQDADENGLVYLASPDGEFLAVEGRFLTTFQPICDPDVRMVLAAVMTELNGHLMDGKPLDSSAIIETQFMIERAMNSGHIELIAIDTANVLNRAIQTLEAEGLTKNVVDLYVQRDKLNFTPPQDASQLFGASVG